MKILKIYISNDKQGPILQLFRIDPQKTAVFFRRLPDSRSQHMQQGRG